MFIKVSAVCETKFHYQDKTPPSDYVVNIAGNMQVVHLFHSIKYFLGVVCCLSEIIEMKPFS